VWVVLGGAIVLVFGVIGMIRQSRDAGGFADRRRRSPSLRGRPEGDDTSPTE
jgi:hypothetical protein